MVESQPILDQPAATGRCWVCKRRPAPSQEASEKPAQPSRRTPEEKLRQAADIDAWLKTRGEWERSAKAAESARQSKGAGRGAGATRRVFLAEDTDSADRRSDEPQGQLEQSEDLQEEPTVFSDEEQHEAESPGSEARERAASASEQVHPSSPSQPPSAMRNFEAHEVHQATAQLPEAWVEARAIAIRPGSGAFVLLPQKEGQAWLPLQKVKPPVDNNGDDFTKAMKSSLRVRVQGYDPEVKLPSVTMWSVAEEADWPRSYQREAVKARRERQWRKEQERLSLRHNLDPNRWVDGTVVGVKPYGIFVNIMEDVDVMVYVRDIPEVFTVPFGPDGERAPDLELGEEVQIRLLSHLGVEPNGRDKYRCTMMPQSSQTGDEGGKGKGKGKSSSKGGSGKALEGYSVFSQGRALESESTLARQENFELNTLKAEDLEKEFGHTDRKVQLAKKGFAIVDYATSLQLQEVCKLSKPLHAPDPKAQAKPDAKPDGKAKPESKPELKPEIRAPVMKPLQVWLVCDKESKPVGRIQIPGSMTDHEKEQMAVNFAIQEVNEAVQGGSNISRVEITDKSAIIKLKVYGSLHL